MSDMLCDTALRGILIQTQVSHCGRSVSVSKSFKPLRPLLPVCTANLGQWSKRQVTMPGLAPNSLPTQRDIPEPMGHVGSDGMEEIEKIERYPTPIELKHQDLQLAHSNLQLAHNKLQLAYNSLGSELRRLQELDFNARKKDQAEPHGTTSQRFLNVFRMSTDWARDYFKIHINLFCLDDHELFKKHLTAVSWEGTDWTKKRELNVSHLVQAVVAEVLARRILLSPFAGCPSSFRHEFGQLYEVMLKGWYS